MSTITYQNIIVDGIPFTKINELYISHAPNSHGRAVIAGELDTEFAKKFVQRADETFAVQIKTSAEGQPSTLFYGSISNMYLESQADYSYLTIEAATTSALLDAGKHNKTFQNTSQTYGQILNSVVSGMGSVSVMVTDKPIGSMIMQCNETDWEFIIRMASQFNVPAFANIVAKKAQIYIGLPPSNKTRTIETVSYDYGKNDASFHAVLSNNAGASGAMREDFASEVVKSYDYAYLGDIVNFNGKSSRVKTIEAKLTDGILQCSYSFALQTGFVAPTITNKQASGKMMSGIVKAVEADKVQVFLSSVDSSYDGGGNWWFPYSTAYSSQDGSGWYCMPAVGDEVRVFFPSDNEADAFAASSVCKNVRANIKDKCWSGPNGKQLLMTEDGFVITCKEGKVYIKLTDEKGIEIISEGDINITSAAKVNIQAGDSIKVIAEKQIIVGTEQSYIDIRNEAITAASENVIIT